MDVYRTSTEFHKVSTERVLVILHYNLLLGNSYLNYIASISSIFGLEAEVVGTRSCVRSYLNLIG